MKQIKVGDLAVEIVQKDIKNIHLGVYPPAGRVRISAPLRMREENIRIYAISRLSWIRKQQEKIRSQEREAPREYLSRESHYYLGKRYLLKIKETDGISSVKLGNSALELYARKGSDLAKKREILENWYRERLKEIIPSYISKWEKVMSVKVAEFGVKKMRTKWGTCNPEAGRIWLNLELAKKPRNCVEYIVVHEMVHLQERTHNARFISLMDNYLPNWRSLKEDLNRLPVSHQEWDY